MLQSLKTLVGTFVCCLGFSLGVSSVVRDFVWALVLLSDGNFLNSFPGETLPEKKQSNPVVGTRGANLARGSQSY